MRTTVRLDDDLLRRAKIRAAEEGVTLTALIERGLERVLAGEQKGKGVREEGAVFETSTSNPLDAITPYELPPKPGESGGYLDYITDPIQLAKAIEFDEDRASYIRSGGIWPD